MSNTFIKLTAALGGEDSIYVNISLIAYFAQYGTGTAIYLTGISEYIYVKETAYDINNILKEIRNER